MGKYQFIKLDGTVVSEYNSYEEVDSVLKSLESLHHYWYDTGLVESLSEFFKDSEEKLDSIVIIKLIEE